MRSCSDSLITLEKPPGWFVSGEEGFSSRGGRFVRPSGKEQRGGGVHEDRVVERGLNAERKRHREGEKRQQAATRPSNRAPPDAEKKCETQSKLGDGGKDGQSGSKDGRQETVYLRGVGHEIRKVTPTGASLSKAC